MLLLNVKRRFRSVTHRRIRLDADSGKFRVTKTGPEEPAVAFVASRIQERVSDTIPVTPSPAGSTFSASVTTTIDPSWWRRFPLEDLDPTLRGLDERDPEVARTQLLDLRAIRSAILYAKEELDADGIELVVDGNEVSGYLLHRSELALKLNGINVGDRIRAAIEDEVGSLDEFRITKVPGNLNRADAKLKEFYTAARMRSRRTGGPSRL